LRATSKRVTNVLLLPLCATDPACASKLVHVTSTQPRHCGQSQVICPSPVSVPVAATWPLYPCGAAATGEHQARFVSWGSSTW
jgi:hypothetical protein